MSNPKHNDELTGDESLDELEAWLDRQEDAGVVDESIPADESESSDEMTFKTDEVGNADTPAESATADTQVSDSDGQDVLAKDGVHTIPHSVLQSEREKNQSLLAQNQTQQQRIEELEANHTDSEKRERLIELRNKQLTNLGVSLEDLPEDITVSDEQLEQLAEDYPEIARPMLALNAKIKSLESKSQAASQAATQPVNVHAIIQSIPEIAAMQAEGGDDWRSAMALDDQLKADPVWQAKPMSERFVEVARRVTANKNMAHQSAAQLAAQQAVETAKNQLPNSPSEVGNTNKHQASPKEFLESASAEQIQAKLMSMSLDDMEAYLEASGI